MGGRKHPLRIDEDATAAGHPHHPGISVVGLKDAADDVTASVYEDGAAHEISRWF